MKNLRMGCIYQPLLGYENMIISSFAARGMGLNSGHGVITARANHASAGFSAESTGTDLDAISSNNEFTNKMKRGYEFPSSGREDLDNGDGSTETGAGLNVRRA